MTEKNPTTDDTTEVPYASPDAELDRRVRPQPVGRDRDTLEDIAEKKNVSIGLLVAYAVGGLTMLAGIASVGQDLLGAITFLAAGTFGLPPTRRLIEDELGIHFSRWLAVMIYIGILFLGASFAV